MYHLYDIIVAVKNNDFKRAEELADACLLDRFLSLIEEGALGQVKTMINQKLISDVYQFNQGIIRAAEYNRLDILKYLLLLQDINPATHDNQALQVACKRGHNDIIRYLLSLPKKSYKKRGSALLKKQLLQQEGFMKQEETPDTTVLEVNEKCMYYACSFGHMETIKLLLTYKTDIIDADCIEAAVEYPEILRFLLSLHVEVTVDAFTRSCSLDCIESAKMLQPYVKESALRLGLRQACLFNKLESVKYLLEFVDADDYCYKMSKELGHKEIIKLLKFSKQK